MQAALLRSLYLPSSRRIMCCLLASWFRDLWIQGTAMYTSGWDKLVHMILWKLYRIIDSNSGSARHTA